MSPEYRKSSYKFILKIQITCQKNQQIAKEKRRCSKPLAIREIQIKATRRYYSSYLS